MDRAEIVAKIQDVMIDVLDLDELNLTEATTAKDVEGWDSLTNIRLILAVETAFGIRLSAAQVSALAQLGDLVSVIERKLNQAAA